MPPKPWDRDIAPERYHIQTLRLIRICVLLGSDAIRCWIGIRWRQEYWASDKPDIEPISPNGRV